MKSILKYVFTKREKLLLVIAALLALAGIWYCSIYQPVRMRIEAADTGDLENEIAAEQLKAQKLQMMREEIEANKEAGLARLQTYNYFKKEVEELNIIFASAAEFQFDFSEPAIDGNTVRRDMSVSFGAKSYDGAVSMLDQIRNSSCRTMIHDVSIACGNKTTVSGSENIADGPVKVSFYMTAYETTIDSDSTAGLEMPETEASKSGGLADADLSDLKRSDLETAAEAVLEK